MKFGNSDKISMIYHSIITLISIYNGSITQQHHYLSKENSSPACLIHIERNSAGNCKSSRDTKHILKRKIFMKRISTTETTLKVKRRAYWEIRIRKYDTNFMHCETKT